MNSNLVKINETSLKHVLNVLTTKTEIVIFTENKLSNDTVIFKGKPYKAFEQLVSLLTFPVSYVKSSKDGEIFIVME